MCFPGLIMDNLVGNLCNNVSNLQVLGGVVPPGQIHLGLPSSFHMVWREASCDSQIKDKWFLFWVVTHKSTQEAQTGANGCWSSAFVHTWHDCHTRRKKSQSIERPTCQETPRWDSCLVCNQEWLPGMNQRLWRGEQSNVYLLCGCHFPWQPRPVSSVLLEIMSNHLFLSLSLSIWDNVKGGK